MDRIEFPFGVHAISDTHKIETYPHGYYAGWFHGALVDVHGNRLAHTSQAYPDKVNALRVMSAVLMNNIVHT